MVEKTKKQKKGSIDEEDVSTLLQRYSPLTVLTVLQEVEQVPDMNIDWNALVEKTSSGISNAREYQMLWRHLAYRNTLHEVLDDEAEPLDDDSDLEYELEAFPAVSSEASTEAAAYVKVLIASGAPTDSSLPNGTTVEAPLTINIPNGQSSGVSSENSQLAIQGKNITIPVFVQKLPLPAAEGMDANGSTVCGLPPRKKRKRWSTAEDMELIAAVQKCGEGNWATILKGDFKGDRTASQLSQRWSIIRKRQANLNVGSGSQPSEAQLAARRAVSLALNMPMVDNLTASCSISTAGTISNTMPSNSSRPTAGEALSVGGSISQTQHQSPQGSVPTIAPRMGTAGSSSKSQVTSKKASTKSAISQGSLVKAAAVTAGAHIATPLDAASLLKATQAKNAIPIVPGGGSLIKPSVAGNANPFPSTHSDAPPNVHYIRTGLAATPFSSYPAVPSNASGPSGTQQGQGNSVRPAEPPVQLNPSATASTSNMSSEVTNAATSCPAKDEVKIKEERLVSGSHSAPKEQVQEDQVAVSGNAPEEQVQEELAVVSDNALREQAQEDQTCGSTNAPEEHVAGHQASILANTPNKKVGEDKTALPNLEAIETDFVENSKCSSSVETAEDDPRFIISN